jgi:aminoglycoside phosphotransferase (APT) family kinase protein
LRTGATGHTGATGRCNVAPRRSATQHYQTAEEGIIPSETPSRAETDRARFVLERVADSLSGRLASWRSTAIEPTDDGYLYGYELDLDFADGRAERRLVFVEDTPGTRRIPGVLYLPPDGQDAAVAVWAYPNDPALPVLRRLTEIESTEDALSAVGIEAAVTSTEVISYRPGRRAVVRAETPAGSLYLKVVEPRKAAPIAERHRQFRSSSLPVPKLLGWSGEGLVAISPLPGVDAQSMVRRIDRPDAFLDQVEFLSSLLAAVPAVNTARASLLARIDWYVERLASRIPAERDRIVALGAEVEALGRNGRQYLSGTVTVHGDLHLGQLFVDPDDPGSVTGMLDIDTAGAGDPADDAAAFYAHLIALGEMAGSLDSAYSDACWDLAARWLSRWRRNRNAGFAARATAIAATHLLGHALRPITSDPEETSIRLLRRAEDLVAGRSVGA